MSRICPKESILSQSYSFNKSQDSSRSGKKVITPGLNSSPMRKERMPKKDFTTVGNKYMPYNSDQVFKNHLRAVKNFNRTRGKLSM